MPPSVLADTRPSVKYLAPALFTAPMSLAGLGLVCQRLEAVMNWRAVASVALLVVAAATYAAVLWAYGLKVLRHFDAVAADWLNPAQMCFFAPAGMTLVLLATGLLNLGVQGATWLWAIGALVLAATALATISAWLGRGNIQMAQLVPVWLLPAVGPSLIVHAGVRLGWSEACWIIYALAVVLWIGLLPIILTRLLFGPPMTAASMPSVNVLVAPPALLFIADVELSGGLIHSGHFFFGAMTAFGLLLLTRLRGLLQSPFSLAWWAFSFPNAAWASATISYAVLTGSSVFLGVGAAVLAGTLVITSLVCIRTLTALWTGDLIRRPG